MRVHIYPRELGFKSCHVPMNIFSSTASNLCTTCYGSISPGVCCVFRYSKYLQGIWVWGGEHAIFAFIIIFLNYIFSWRYLWGLDRFQGHLRFVEDLGTRDFNPHAVSSVLDRLTTLFKNDFLKWTRIHIWMGNWTGFPTLPMHGMDVKWFDNKYI